MATKIATAQKRLFQDVYVCKNCSKKIRTQAVKVLTGKVKCPRCKKIGTLRQKQKGQNTLIVSHYNRERYQKGSSGTKPCYIGSMNTATFKIFEKYFPRGFGNEEFREFDKAWHSLKNELKNEITIKDIEPTSEGLEKFTAILNELRKIKQIENKIKRIKSKKISWTIPCHKCKTENNVHATFHGLDMKKRIHIYFDKIDTTKD